MYTCAFKKRWGLKYAWRRCTLRFSILIQIEKQAHSMIHLKKTKRHHDLTADDRHEKKKITDLPSVSLVTVENIFDSKTGKVPIASQ